MYLWVQFLLIAQKYLPKKFPKFEKVDFEEAILIG